MLPQIDDVQCCTQTHTLGKKHAQPTTRSSSYRLVLAAEHHTAEQMPDVHFFHESVSPRHSVSPRRVLQNKKNLLIYFGKEYESGNEKVVKFIIIL